MSDIVKNGSPTSSSVIINKLEKPDLGEVSHELLTLLGLKGIYPLFSHPSLPLPRDRKTVFRNQSRRNRMVKTVFENSKFLSLKIA